MSVVAAAIITSTVVGANEASKSRKAQSAAINSELELAKDEYENYKTNIMPLEIEAKKMGITAQSLAVQRGKTDLNLYNDYYVPLQKEMIDAATDVEADYDRVARDAGMDVDKAFERQKDIEQRDAMRSGLRPDSGAYKGMDRQRELTQAGTRSFAINRAREDETRRVEDTKFSRMATVLGRQPGAIAPRQGAANPQAPGGLSQAYGRQADMYGAQAGRQSQGAADALYTGAKMYSQFKGTGGGTPSTYTPFSGSHAQGQQNFDTMDFDAISADSTAFKDGGLVEEKRYAQGGLIEGPGGVDNVPGSINDNEPARLTDGEFVIPRDVVMKKGTEFFEKMLEQYHEGPPPKNSGLKDKRGMH